MIEKIIDTFEGETFLKADGFDDAIIGVDESTMRLIYSVSKSIEILMRNNMSYEDALEYFYFNQPLKSFSCFLECLSFLQH